MKKHEPWQAWTFIGIFSLIAFFINHLTAPPAFHSENIRVERSTVTFPREELLRKENTNTSVTPQNVLPKPEAQEILGRPNNQSVSPPPEDPAVTKARFIARYLKNAPAKVTDIKQIAVAVESEDGKWSKEVGRLISKIFESESTKPFASVFSNDFLADGLFTEIFQGTLTPIQKLDLAKNFDFLILGKLTVEYSTNPTLEDVITATLSFDLMAFNLAEEDQKATQSFSAAGAGFKNIDALKQAEERLIKQLRENSKPLTDLLNQDHI
jgi:hypothetical protein